MLNSLKLYEKLNDKQRIATNLGNIGLVYKDQNKFSKALEFYLKALKINKKLNNKNGIATNLSNIGMIYLTQKKYTKALEANKEALKLFQELGDKSGAASNLGYIALIYQSMNNYPEALKYYKKAVKLFNELGDKKGIAINLAGMADLYNSLKQYEKALVLAKKAAEAAKEVGVLETEKFAYSCISDAYAGLGNYKKALEYKNKFIELKDSIFNDKKKEELAKLELKYEFEKKVAVDSISNAKQLEIKNAQIAKINAEKESERKQRNLLFIVLILTLIFVVFVIYSYIQKNKINRLLSKQKNEIIDKNRKLYQLNVDLENQRNEIADKNEELNKLLEEVLTQRDQIYEQKNKIEQIHEQITLSINYAKRIQTTILPSDEILSRYFTEHFIFFNPKDVVSGDFYWWTHINDNTIISVADCTGHGVPGAFMSLLGTLFLNKIVQEQNETDPGTILNKLRKEIIKTLKQKGELREQKDGMDMALISVNHKTKELQFSGANNPIYIIKSGKLEIINKTNIQYDEFSLNDSSEYKLYTLYPDKMPISIYKKMDDFSTYQIRLEKDERIYLFTDGFADQFGGPKGKKFKYKAFKELLLRISDKPMKEQKEILEKTFYEWKGDLEQIDDVTVVGIKI